MQVYRIVYMRVLIKEEKIKICSYIEVDTLIRTSSPLAALDPLCFNGGESP